MECLANTGFDASPWLVVAIIAVAAVVAGLLIAKRGRRAGIGTLTVLALGIAATLALAPAPNAHASASECPAPPSNSAQPTPAPTSESTSATPDPTSSSPAPTSSTPEPTPTTTPTTDPTTPTSTTPTTTACVPDQSALWTAPEAAFVNVQPRQTGENEVSWAYTFNYEGANAAEVINKLGVTTTENENELKLNNVTGDPTVTPPAPDGFAFSHVEGSAEGTDSVRIDVYFSKAATPAEIEAIMKDYAPPFGKKISATFPLKGEGKDCDGAPVDDEAVLAQCLPLRDVNIDSDGEATQLGNPGRSILSTYSELDEGTDLHRGGSVIGTITPESLAPILEALSVTKLADVTETSELLTTPQTAGKYTLGKPTFTRDGTTVEIPAQFVPKLHIVNGVAGQPGKGLGITWNADFDGSTPEGEAAAREALDQMRELMVPDGDQFASYPSELSIPVTVETECGPETITITVTGLSGQLANPGNPGGND